MPRFSCRSPVLSPFLPVPLFSSGTAMSTHKLRRVAHLVSLTVSLQARDFYRRRVLYARQISLARARAGTAAFITPSPMEGYPGDKLVPLPIYWRGISSSPRPLCLVLGGFRVSVTTTQANYFFLSPDVLAGGALNAMSPYFLISRVNQ